MRSILLQDWLSVTADVTVTSIAQRDPYSLNIDPYDDLVFYLQVTAAAASGYMNYETCPADDDTSYGLVLPAFPVATGVRIDNALGPYVALPPGRLLRWRLGGLQAGRVTFRIRFAHMMGS